MWSRALAALLALPLAASQIPMVTKEISSGEPAPYGTRPNGEYVSRLCGLSRVCRGG
jgi:hypothetical protein